MIKLQGGQSRVVIENVSPDVDGGRYLVKRTIGEIIEISADFVFDGHDQVRAEVLYRHEDQSRNKSLPMEHHGNDRWRASFPAEKTGFYTFTIHAWIDHFFTWHHDFIKKAEAGLNLKVELMEGAEYLKKFNKKKIKQVTGWISLLGNTRKYNQAVETVLSEEFHDFVASAPDKQFPTKFEREIRIEVERQKSLFSSWYEFFPRSTSAKKGKHGTLKDAINLIPRVKSMGFDVIYLPPVHPIGEVNRKGKNNTVKANKSDVGSPWGIGSKHGGHKDIHPELGTLKDYKTFVKAANDAGIEVAMDLAYQCAPDHPYVKEHPQWFRWRPDGTVQYAENPPKKYQDILPIYFETADWKNLWKELKSVVIFWIKQGIRIFRVDNPHTKPIEFWEWLIREVRDQYPDTIFLAEAFTRPKIMSSLAKSGFNQSYTYFTWRNTKQELIEYMDELIHDTRNFFRPNFWPNTPDILPYSIQQFGENNIISRYVLAATLSSNYGIYGAAFEMMENTPVEGKEEYLNSEKFEIKHYDWKKTNRMTEIISQVNRLRHENPALQDTWNLEFLEIHNDQILAYIKSTPDLSNVVLVVVNLDPYNRQSGYIRLPLEKLGIQGPVNIKLVDEVTQDRFTWTGEWNYVELDPNQIPFHLFKLEVRESQM